MNKNGTVTNNESKPTAIIGVTLLFVWKLGGNGHMTSNKIYAKNEDFETLRRRDECRASLWDS
jgi:hypothetical protein